MGFTDTPLTADFQATNQHAPLQAPPGEPCRPTSYAETASGQKIELSHGTGSRRDESSRFPPTKRLSHQQTAAVWRQRSLNFTSERANRAVDSDTANALWLFIVYRFHGDGRDPHTWAGEGNGWTEVKKINAFEH